MTGPVIDDHNMKFPDECAAGANLAQPSNIPSVADLRDCLDFWNHYSSIDELAQDELVHEKNAMLKKMASWLK